MLKRITKTPAETHKGRSACMGLASNPGTGGCFGAPRVDVSGDARQGHATFGRRQGTALERD